MNLGIGPREEWVGGEFDFYLGGLTIVSEKSVRCVCRRILFCSVLSPYLLCVRLVLCSVGSRVRPSSSAVSYASASVLRWSRTCHRNKFHSVYHYVGNSIPLCTCNLHKDRCVSIREEQIHIAYSASTNSIR